MDSESVCAPKQEEPLSTVAAKKGVNASLSKGKLLEKRDFERVKRRGYYRCGHFIKVKILYEAGSKARLGIAASKRFGNAVERNRFKRIARVAFQEIPISTSCDLIIYPKEEAKLANAHDIANELSSLIDQSHSPKRKPEKSSSAVRG